MYGQEQVTAIIMAAGTGSRMGAAVPKQFLKIKGRTVLERAVLPFENNGFVDDILVVCGQDFVPLCKRLCSAFSKVRAIITGGEQRQDSVRNAINALEIGADGYVLIHDGARPFVTDEIICRVLAGAADTGAAVCAVPVKDTVRRITEEGSATLDRSQLCNVQTPQGFKAAVIRDAFAAADSEGFVGTDDAGLAERAGYHVTLVKGSYDNIKITTREDMPVETRIGSGFDVHKMTDGRKMILCGVDIPFEKGLLGHSDADVALHALMDAMLGAAALGDIGSHFPDTDDTYKGISSMELLRQTAAIIDEAGYRLANADVTIIAQRPKIAPYIREMRENIAEALGVDIENISVKATTTEKLGFTGREEGIAAQAVCLLDSK